jgi:hypothetical protein
VTLEIEGRQEGFKFMVEEKIVLENQMELVDVYQIKKQCSDIKISDEEPELMVVKRNCLANIDIQGNKCKIINVYQ